MDDNTAMRPLAKLLWTRCFFSYTRTVPTWEFERKTYVTRGVVLCFYSDGLLVRMGQSWKTQTIPAGALEQSAAGDLIITDLRHGLLSLSAVAITTSQHIEQQADTHDGFGFAIQYTVVPYAY